MRRLIHQAVRSVAELFLKAVLHESDYRELFTAIVLGFFVTFNRLISAHSGVSCATVLDVSLMFPLLILLGLCSRASNLFLSCRIRQEWVSVFVLFLDLKWRRFDRHFDGFLRGTSSLQSTTCSAAILYRRYMSVRYSSALWRIGNSVLPLFYTCIRLSPDKRQTRRQERICSSIIFEYPSTAALASKTFWYFDLASRQLHSFLADPA